MILPFLLLMAFSLAEDTRRIADDALNQGVFLTRQELILALRSSKAVLKLICLGSRAANGVTLLSRHSITATVRSFMHQASLNSPLEPYLSFELGFLVGPGELDPAIVLQLHSLFVAVL